MSARRHLLSGKINLEYYLRAAAWFWPPHPPFCVSAGMIGVTGEWTVSAGIVELRRERQSEVSSREFTVRCEERRGWRRRKDERMGGSLRVVMIGGVAVI